MSRDTRQRCSRDITPRSTRRTDASWAERSGFACTGGGQASVVRGQPRVGCSGWVYRDWRGVVYPKDAPEREWFRYYAARFDTVELNDTFYRLPPVETAELWA